MKLQSLPAALVLVAAMVVAGVLVGLDRPVPAALLALLGLVVQSCLPAVVAAPAPAVAAPKVPPLPLLLAIVALAGCSAAERAVAAGVIGDVAGLTPTICALVAIGNPSAGAACSTDAGAAADVANIVARIIGSLPASMGATVPGVAGFEVTYRGKRVAVTVPASQRAGIQRALAGG